MLYSAYSKLFCTETKEIKIFIEGVQQIYCGCFKKKNVLKVKKCYTCWIITYNKENNNYMFLKSLNLSPPDNSSDEI